MKLAVIGTGYVGLVAGACFADAGHAVCCVDVDAERIRRLQSGQLPFHEPDLAPLVERTRQAGTLRFSTELAPAVVDVDVVFLAVGTPETGPHAELSALLDAATQLAKALPRPTLIVDKSTVPVGTAERLQAFFAQHARVTVEVVSNPEFLREGSAVRDFRHPDRVIVGATSASARHTLAQLYAPFVSSERPLLFMDTRSAELAKYAANAMLATRISFMNDLAAIAERVGADIDAVRVGLESDPRIGAGWLSAGVGYGGSCLGKDVRALTATARHAGLDGQLLNAVEAINARQKTLLADKAVAHFGADLSGRSFALWGLSFKPDTDDLREAPSLALIDALLARGATVRVYDPVAMPAARAQLGDRVTFCSSALAAVEGADALCLVTEWAEFRAPDFARLKSLLAQPVVFDGRNLYSPAALRALGFTYFGVGRA